MSSYQQSNNNGYQQVRVQHVKQLSDDDQDINNNASSSSSELARFWRNRRLVKTALAALVLGAIAWGVTAVVWPRDKNDNDKDTSSASLCDTAVVVDPRGVMEDGPGSDGTCNDPVTWYHDQLINHFVDDENDKEDASNKWTQKCFINDDYFRGPGHPIFFINGGEGDANCFFYPFVTHTLARIFGGMTLECEHRFYGKSQPIDPLTDVRDMIGLLTPEQAMADYLRFRKYTYKQNERHTTTCFGD